MYMYHWYHHFHRLEQDSKSHQMSTGYFFSSVSVGISKFENLSLKMETLTYWKATTENFRTINMHTPFWFPLLNMFFTTNRSLILNIVEFLVSDVIQEIKGRRGTALSNRCLRR